MAACAHVCACVCVCVYVQIQGRGGLGGRKGRCRPAQLS